MPVDYESPVMHELLLATRRFDNVDSSYDKAVRVCDNWLLSVRNDFRWVKEIAPDDMHTVLRKLDNSGKLFNTGFELDVLMPQLMLAMDSVKSNDSSVYIGVHLLNTNEADHYDYSVNNHLHLCIHLWDADSLNRSRWELFKAIRVENSELLLNKLLDSFKGLTIAGFQSKQKLQADASAVDSYLFTLTVGDIKIECAKEQLQIFYLRNLLKNCFLNNQRVPDSTCFKAEYTFEVNLKWWFVLLPRFIRNIISWRQSKAAKYYDMYSENPENPTTLKMEHVAYKSMYPQLQRRQNNG